MGSCISNDSHGNSKLELNDLNSNIYRVTNVDDNGVALWSGQLGITRAELTLYRKGRDPTKWPLKCLRRYGYDADLFSFEAGRRCTTGEGIYAFRCRRAESLFQTLQSHIQQSALDDGNVSVTANDSLAPLTANGPSAMSTSISSNYILPNSRSANQVLRTSPSVCSDGTNRSFDALAAPVPNSPDGNYLEPILTSRSTTLPHLSSVAAANYMDSLSGTASGPLSPGTSIDPHSPGSPNSINNILEVTSLNPLPSSNNNAIGVGVSNIYQEFPLRSGESNINHRENGRKKLSLDIPPQEPAPSVNRSLAGSGTFRFTSTVNSNISTINHSYSNNVQTISNETSSSSQTVSPTQSTTNDTIDSSHMYMNITPGEINNSITKFHYVNTAEQITQTIRNNSSVSAFNIDPNHCYENLEPNEIRPLLLRTQIQQTQTRHLSKTENATRQEPIGSTPTSPLSDKNSEPNTPTLRKFNYIVLDLDQNHTPGQTGNNVSASTTSPTHYLLKFLSNTNLVSATSSSTSSATQSTTSQNSILNTVTSLLPPESPEKGIFDYATIDFNKTVALSNSITPSLDCEGSRKTRHSSTAVPPTLSHSTSVTNTTAPPSHSNSISD